jgi:hypothetical protein
VAVRVVASSPLEKGTACPSFTRRMSCLLPAFVVAPSLFPAGMIPTYACVSNRSVADR